MTPEQWIEDRRALLAYIETLEVDAVALEQCGASPVELGELRQRIRLVHDKTTAQLREALLDAPMTRVH